MAMLRGYVGTYRSPEGAGTYRFAVDTETGVLSEAERVLAAENTKYAVCWPGRCATLTEEAGGAGLCLLDTGAADTALLGKSLPEKVTACSLSRYEEKLYTANYHDGTVLVYEEGPNGLELVRRVEVQEEAGCHQIIFHGNLALIPCLELDEVRFFDTERDWAPAGTISFPRGTGPRHGVFNEDHSRFYLNSERSNELFTFAVAGAEFTRVDVQPILPPDFEGKGDTAALRRSEDGRFLYTTVRGGDMVAVFAVTDGGTRLVQRFHSGGVSPWDLLPVPGGHFVLVSNRKSGRVVSLPVGSDGLLGDPCGSIDIPEAVGLTLE